MLLWRSITNKYTKIDLQVIKTQFTKIFIDYETSANINYN